VYGGGSGLPANGGKSKTVSGQQQYFHVQRIIPAGMDNSQSSGTEQAGPAPPKGGSVKINIVNVHNEFNI